MSQAAAPPRPSWRPSWLPHFPAKAWYHALGTVAAGMLAFYVACALELDSPGSAVVTVLIVSSPLPGMVLSKGIWRFVGTLVGVAISIALIARFAQSPFAFILALAIWLGLCTYTSSLLRHFRAYAAVLAGYTISLVALPALDDPDQIFYLATGRIAVVTVGILCTALVKSLLVLRVGQLRLKPALEGALAATAELAAQALDLTPGLLERRRAVAERLQALDPLILAAANESAETAQQAPAVRLFVSVLVNLITLASSVRDALATLRFESPVAASITPLRDMVRDLLRRLCGTTAFLSPATGEALATARQAARTLTAELTAAPATLETLDALALAIRLEDILGQLELARDLLDDIEHGRTGRQVTPVSYHRDRQAAVINGLRAAIAKVIAGSFWIATAWSSGTQMLAALLPVCALLGTTDAPEQASIAFTRGIALAAVCSFVCEFYLLASVDGFPLLVVMVAPFLLVASLYSTIPKHAGSSTAFLIFFTTFLNLRNPMQYDVAQALNTDVAFVLGSACGVLVFRTLWPANQARSVRRLIAQMRDDLGDLAHRPPASPIIWQTMMLDRLSRLGTRLATSPERAAVIEGGMAAIHIGRDMMRAHHWLHELTLPPDLARRVAAIRVALRDVVRAPDAAIEIARIGTERLLASAGEPEPPADRGRLLRAAADFHDIALLLARHRAFFSGALPTRAGVP